MKVSEGREREEGGWEANTCSSHMQDVSEDVVLYFLVTFNHPEAAELVCWSIHAPSKTAAGR